jgi:hypothetical protein
MSRISTIVALVILALVQVNSFSSKYFSMLFRSLILTCITVPVKSIVLVILLLLLHFIYCLVSHVSTLLLYYLLHYSSLCDSIRCFSSGSSLG